MYRANKIGNSYSQLNSSTYSGTHTESDFYEMEPGIVLDIILDDSHPIFKSPNNYPSINPTDWPDDVSGNPALQTDKNFTWIGRVLVRPLISQQGADKEKLTWAIPLENTGIVEYPLVNETVILVNYFNTLYYSRKLNIKGFLNNNVDFRKEKISGLNSGNREIEVSNSDKTTPYQGPLSYTVSKKYKNVDNVGVMGRYFWSNNNIRSIKKYEGDSVIESRFGQSIRFSAYDSNRQNDQSSPQYKDYVNKDKSKNPKFPDSITGGGNPMILIRNRQRPIKLDMSEKNTGGFVSEDINNDGSSIHITSGLTESSFVPTIKKTIFQEGKEEISTFSPTGCSPFKFPKLIGDQIVINSDRLVFSSKAEETLHFSKKRYAITTDSEYTVDAQDQIVITSNTKTVLNSPAIYLGEYDKTSEPVVLGQTTVDWLYDLCDWILAHIHGHAHIHPHPHIHAHPHVHIDPPAIAPIPLYVGVGEGAGVTSVGGGGTNIIAGVGGVDLGPVLIANTSDPINTVSADPTNTLNANPYQTQISVQQESLVALRDSLEKILSKRVFVTGGGYAPGKYAGSLLKTKINTFSGDGVPGGYFGKIRGSNPTQNI